MTDLNYGELRHKPRNSHGRIHAHMNRTLEWSRTSRVPSNTCTMHIFGLCPNTQFESVPECSDPNKMKEKYQSKHNTFRMSSGIGQTVLQHEMKLNELNLGLI